MIYDFRADRIFASGLSYKEKSGRMNIATKKPVIRIVSLLLIAASIYITIILQPYLEDNTDSWWIIPALWAITIIFTVLYALPHARISYQNNSFTLYPSLFKKPQIINNEEITSVEIAHFTQECENNTTEEDMRPIVEAAIDTTLGPITNLILPIDLIRPRTTFKEDVYAICFILKNKNTIFTHFTWDKTSAKGAVGIIKHICKTPQTSLEKL